MLCHLYHHLQTQALNLQQQFYGEQYRIFTSVIRWEVSICSWEGTSSCSGCCSWRLRLRQLCIQASGFSPMAHLVLVEACLAWWRLTPQQALKCSSSPAAAFVSTLQDYPSSFSIKVSDHQHTATAAGAPSASAFDVDVVLFCQMHSFPWYLIWSPVCCPPPMCPTWSKN